MLKLKGSGGASSLPTATNWTGYMSILNECPGDGYKLCKEQLHWHQGSVCRLCRNAKAKARYHEKKKLGQAWYQLNYEKHLKQGREQYNKNKNERQERWRKWREENLEWDKHRNSLYGKQHPEIIRAKQAKRRSLKKTQTPKWANIKKIKEIYKEAKKIEEDTGVKMHVDHIYPLSSDWMCGLHVENNLQILTRQENCSKSNLFWPGQLPCQKHSICDIFSKELTDLLDE